MQYSVFDIKTDVIIIFEEVTTLPNHLNTETVQFTDQMIFNALGHLNMRVRWMLLSPIYPRRAQSTEDAVVMWNKL